MGNLACNLLVHCLASALRYVFQNGYFCRYIGRHCSREEFRNISVLYAVVMSTCTNLNARNCTNHIIL